MPGKMNKNRFTDNGNGTVTDNLTKLIWLKDANAFGLWTWEQSLTLANGLSSGTAGLTDGSKAGDWRLPNVKELQSLIDFAYTGPALSGKSQSVSGATFVGVQLCGGYWSMIADEDDSEYAWCVCLGSGTVCNDGKASAYYVWPVRAGREAGK